jgi:hypothetical protein
MKYLFYFFIFLTFIFCLIRLFFNIYYYNKENISKGVIKKIEVFEGDTEAPTKFTYKVIDNNGNYFEEVNTDYFDVKKGDSVRFRKIYGNYSKMIRIIKINGKKNNTYYNYADYLSIIYMLIIIVGYVFVKKIIQK